MLTRATRRCRRCTATTVWATEADLAGPWGLCLAHASTPFERGPVPTHREAVHRLVRVLGVDRVEEAPPALPNGPCALCRVSVVRYGPEAASTLCGRCGGSR